MTAVNITMISFFLRKQNIVENLRSVKANEKIKGCIVYYRFTEVAGKVLVCYQEKGEGEENHWPGGPQNQEKRCFQWHWWRGAVCFDHR